MAHRKSPNTCTIEGCERTRHAYGHCAMHRRRLLKNGSVGTPEAKKPIRTCTFESCDIKHDSHGYCANHARQYRQYGHPLSKEEKSRNLSIANTKKGRGLTPANKKERNMFTKTIGQLVMQRDNYTCQICESKEKYLHVDHIKSWSDYPALRYTLSNCRTVCRPCHYYVTFKRKMPKGSKWGFRATERGIA